MQIQIKKVYFEENKILGESDQKGSERGSWDNSESQEV